MMLRRHCGSFLALVPRVAKSAATLMVLGGADVYMGREAELGPLEGAALFEIGQFGRSLVVAPGWWCAGDHAARGAGWL